MATDPREIEELLQRLQDLAEDERQDLLTRLAKTGLQTNGSANRTLFDALSERGMIGSIKDAPPDLSTNPKHMDGFGQDA